MIHGLKAAFKGEEIVRGLDARIEAKRAEIAFKRDEIAGKVLPNDHGWQIPAEEVEQEILNIEHVIRTLALLRNRVLPDETYLLGEKELRTAGLLPMRPDQAPDVDPEKGMRWVTRGTV